MLLSLQRTLGAITARHKNHKYASVPSEDMDEDAVSDDPLEEPEAHLARAKKSGRRKRYIKMGLSILGVGLVAYWVIR